MTPRPHIVVVGAGFAGLEAVKELAKMPVEVTLIDKNNYHQFTPLLYQVATANLETEEIIFPLRKLVRNKRNVTFLRDTIVDIDYRQQSLTTTQKVLYYDYLILALGSKTSYHGVLGAEKYTFNLKQLHQATELKNHILNCFEFAELEEDPEIRHRLLTFAIVGAGPTGVEFAGALAELVYAPLLKDYPKIHRDEISIHLIDSGEVVLKQYHRKLSEYATRRIKKLGIIFESETQVTEVKPHQVILSNAKIINSETIIWSAGIMGQEIVQEWGFELTRNNLITVLPTLQTTTTPEVFAVGDMAQISEDPLPALATVAIQQGSHVANNIRALLRGRKLNNFQYKDRGTMAVIGRNAAVVETKRFRLRGISAWIIWSLLHIFKMGGLRNRLNIVINWIWSYLFREHSARVIISDDIHQYIQMSLPPLVINEK